MGNLASFAFKPTFWISKLDSKKWKKSVVTSTSLNVSGKKYSIVDYLNMARSIDQKKLNGKGGNMERDKKTFLVVLLGIFLLGCTSTVQSSGAAPLDQNASKKIEKNIDIAKINAIAGSCSEQNDPVCLEKMVKEIERIFDSSGYSLNKTLANCYSSRENAIHAMQLGWGDLFLSVFALLETNDLSFAF